MMAAMVETFSALNVTELLRVVWMEVAIASVAAMVYFSLTGYFVMPSAKPNKADAEPRKGVRSPIGKAANQEPTSYQLIAKALRQGKVSSAISLVQELPETMAGSVSANVAPRLLMAAAKAANFDEIMSELGALAGKIEARSFEAVVVEALKNKDVAACRQLQVMSGLMSITRSTHALEALAKGLASDAACLRMLVEETEAPFAKSFAKAVLEACTALKDIDLTLDVFEKVAEGDAAALRDVVEKASTAPAASENSAPKDGVNACAKEIRACGKSGDLNAAMAIFEQQRKHSTLPLLYNSIMDACVECANLEKALEIFSDARSNGVADVVSYNTAMKGYLSQGNVAAAQKLLVELSEKGLTPTLASYHGLLNFHVNARDRDGAWKLVEEMQAASVKPTSVTCSILLKGKLSSQVDVNKVLSLVDTIEPMDEVLFASLADACIRTGQLHLLSKYQSKLSGQGSSLALTAPTYGSMIKAYGQIRDMKRVRELWAEMISGNVQPTAITLGCMVESLVANWCTAEAWQIVQDMRSDESTKSLVNTVIYSTILKGFANAKETDKVMALYDEMRANGIQANTITYNTILNAFAQGGSMERVPSLLEDMKTTNVEPDIVTYSTIVKGFCNSGSLDRGLEILKEMQTDGKFTPDEVLYNSLLDGCAKEHRPNDALKLLEDMKKNSVAPSNYTLSMLVKLMGRCRRLNQAFSIIEDFGRDYGLKMNIQVYTCLIQACFNNRQAAKAVALHDQMVKEGLFPDEMTYSALVKGCLQAGLVDKAVHLARCAHGLAVPRGKGMPPGINARCIDELANALGAAPAKALLAEFAQCQVGKGNGKGKAGFQSKGSGKGSSKGSNAPWRQERA